MPSLLEAKRLATLGNVWLSEAIVAEFLGRGYYDAHLRELQRELDERYLRCLELLRACMPEGVRWTTPGGGPTLWLEVPRSLSLERLVARLLDRGVSADVASSGFVGEHHLHGLRVGYAFLAPEALARAVHLLAEAMREELP